RAGEEARIEEQVLLGLLLLQRGPAGGDGAVERQREEVRLYLPGFDAPGAVGQLLHLALRGEGLEVAHHRRLTAKAKLPLNLTRGRRHAVVGLVSADKVEDFFLSFSHRFE